MDTYRKDIDGLRAFAVLPVVLFHAGYSTLSGGFVGVDIFFVISGYLITGIIFREIRSGTFSLSRFYERRIRRIFPAALVVTLVTTIAAALFIPSALFKKVGWALVFMNFYATNILFHRQSGYFETDSELNPFLHTWSLSVEEQFYLFFPLFLLAASRLFKNKIFGTLLGATIASFIASCAATFIWPTSAFYLIPFRAWELALGSLLAIHGSASSVRPQIATFMSALGLALIVLAVLSIDETTTFPGFAALLPCAGAALLLYAGAQPGNVLNGFMGNPSLRYFGLISYSLYLWHWPIFVIARFWYPMGLSPSAQLAQLGLAWLCAHLSWRYVEAPFREKTLFPERQNLFRFFGASAAAMVLLGLAIVYSNGFALRMPARSLAYEAAARDNNPERERCHGDDDKNIEPAHFCDYGAPSTPPAYALWGDSHGAELSPAFGALLGLSRQALKMFTYSQCPPALDFSTVTRQGCIAHNDRVLTYLREHSEIETVFLIAHYRVYEVPNYRAAFEAGFARAAAELNAAGKRVIVIYPIPGAQYPIPLMAAALSMRGETADALQIPMARYRKINSDALAFLDALPEVERLHPEAVLCATNACRIALDEKLLYFDNSHLNMLGARFVANAWRHSITGKETPPPTETPPLPPSANATLAVGTVQ